ncbi:hypothetical protein FACS1894110_10190 [Spirochaetia bacterium]|nr:hypothetical protein FACS1894110_10190 [Spirochaetia bacterium]
MKDGFYCAAEGAVCGGGNINEIVSQKTPGFCERCPCMRRKYETPEQFKERAGREYPDDWAVYVVCKGHPHVSICSFKDAKKIVAYYKDMPQTIICVNTDFGLPPGDFEVTE